MKAWHRHNFNRSGGSGASGSTLIEVAISVLIVSMGVVALLTGMVQGMMTNYGVAQRVAAYGLCSDRFEQMRGTDFDALDASNFPVASIKITHLGGSACVPLLGTRSCTIIPLKSPERKKVTVKVAWDYCGKSFSEELTGVIYHRKAKEPPADPGGAVIGEIAVNPNNSPDNEFCLTLSDGTEYTRDNLNPEFGGYEGNATLVHIRPKGGGGQNTLQYNGSPYTFDNNVTYEIVGDNMAVKLYNDWVNGAGKAMGHWYISITASNALITVQ